MLNGKWSKHNFEIHHQKNPEVWAKFLRFALQAASRRPYYSARGIFHRIRWETQIEENDSEFKIDDGWSPHYARKFMREYPEYPEFFETRIRVNGYFTDEAA